MNMVMVPKEELDLLRKALKVAALHSPGIRLAPERRYTIAAIEAALSASQPDRGGA
jgi:hypothetical protein